MSISRGPTPAYIESTRNKLGIAPKKRISKEQKKVLNYNDDNSKKPDHNLIRTASNTKKYHMVAVNSQFRSGNEIAASIVSSMLKVDEPFPVKKIDSKSIMVDQQISKNEKAAILARKYKREHYLMNKFSKKKFIHLTDGQVNLIFDIAKQIKQSIGELK